MLDQQRIVAVIVILGKCRKILAPQGADGAEPPVLVVKKAGIGLAIDEVVGIALPVGGAVDLGKALKPPGDQALKLATFDARGAQRHFGRARRAFRDEIARPPARRQVIGTDEFSISQRHGDAADAQMLGQAARRGHLLPRTEPTCQNPFGDHLANALLQGPARGGGQDKGFGGDRHSGLKSPMRLDLSCKWGRRCQAPGALRPPDPQRIFVPHLRQRG